MLDSNESPLHHGILSNTSVITFIPIISAQNIYHVKYELRKEHRKYFI